MSEIENTDLMLIRGEYSTIDREIKELRERYDSEANHLVFCTKNLKGWHCNQPLNKQLDADAISRQARRIAELQRQLSEHNKRLGELRPMTGWF